MNTYRVTTIPGDGIGKEVVPAGQQLMQVVASLSSYSERFETAIRACCCCTAPDVCYRSAMQQPWTMTMSSMRSPTITWYCGSASRTSRRWSSSRHGKALWQMHPPQRIWSRTDMLRDARVAVFVQRFISASHGLILNVRSPDRTAGSSAANASSSSLVIPATAIIIPPPSSSRNGPPMSSFAATIRRR